MGFRNKQTSDSLEHIAWSSVIIYQFVYQCLFDYKDSQLVIAELRSTYIEI